jgi:hypothetical protein
MSLLYAKVEGSSKASYLSKGEKRMSKGDSLALTAAIFKTKGVSRVDLRE